MTSLGQQSGEFLRLKGLLLREEKQLIAQIQELVRKHEERIGDDEALQHSVAEILADALREAEVQNHRELATSLAPVLVASIKREIRNSSDEVVDALYPIMGRLIAAYVASAVRDFVHQANHQIESGLTARFLRLRFKSLITRTPYRTLLLREGMPLRISSIYIINRSSGVLIERWNADLAPQPPQNVDDHLIGGMLSAINNFAAEVFTSEDSELRSLELGDSRIYLRASASYLLAVKAEGRASRSTEHVLDREMHQTIEKLTRTPMKTAQVREILAEFAESVNAALMAQKKPPVLALTVMVGLLLVAVFYGVQHYRYTHAITALHTAVHEVIANDRELRSYPLQIDVASDRSKVTLSGLVPSGQARDRLIREVEPRISPAKIEAQLFTVSPGEKFQELTNSIASINDELSTLRRIADTQSTEVRAKIEQKSAELTERIAQLQAQIESPQQRLSQWVRTHAVFFSDGTTYTDDKLAERTLAELHELLNQSKAAIRIVGYTDTSGTTEKNDTLATERADKVAKELAALGLPTEQMKVLGRPHGQLLSQDKGPLSSNRRVEFELTYSGEALEAKGEPIGPNGTRTEGHAPR
jgi:outer membrane protein OmpA-like peptidoglycan-associated protein